MDGLTEARLRVLSLQARMIDKRFDPNRTYQFDNEERMRRAAVAGRDGRAGRDADGDGIKGEGKKAGGGSGVPQMIAAGPPAKSSPGNPFGINHTVPGYAGPNKHPVVQFGSGVTNTSAENMLFVRTDVDGAHIYRNDRFKMEQIKIDDTGKVSWYSKPKGPHINQYDQGLAGQRKG